MSKNISIIIADDHPLLLNGLHQQLKAYNYNVVLAAENGAIALDGILKHEPDIAILDIEMPLISGFEIIKKCKEQNIATKFIAYTYHKERSFILQANNLNIKGYLLKDEPTVEIHKAIQTIINGDTFFSQTFTDIYNNNVYPELKKIGYLTPSERVIIRFIAQEKSSKEIAEELSISIRTVQKHRTNIIAKLDLPTAKDALTDWVNNNKDFILSM